MSQSEIQVGRHYRNEMNGKVVKVLEVSDLTVRFEGCEVPMLKSLFAKNFIPFS